jgi:hypothetical protein
MTDGVGACKLQNWPWKRQTQDDEEQMNLKLEAYYDEAGFVFDVGLSVGRMRRRLRREIAQYCGGSGG